jgi:hypothetical protein
MIKLSQKAIHKDIGNCTTSEMKMHLCGRQHLKTLVATNLGLQRVAAEVVG